MKTNSLDFDAQALREKILDLAMRGKLVKQDPNDEPASVLLEKIKAEKAELVKEKKIKKSKSLPEITDDEKPFDIPDSWEWVRLGEIGSIISGGTPKKSEKSYWDKANIPWITPASMAATQNEIVYKNDDLKFINKNGLEHSSAHLISANSIVVSSRAPIGYVNIVPFDYTTNQGCKSIAPYTYIENKYIYFVIKFTTPDMYKRASGTTFKEISGTRFGETVIPLPPLEEQSRIAAKIAQLFALLRKVESSNQQYAKLQTLLKSKVLDLAMRGKLVKQDPNDEPACVLLEKIKAEKAELVKEKKIKKSKPLPEITDEEKPFDIPDSWEWVRFDDILDVRDGTHDTPKYVANGVPLITSKNINSGKLDFTNINFISENDFQAINARSKVDKGDIIFAMIGTIGNPVLVDTDRKFGIKNVALLKHFTSELNMYFVLDYLLVLQVMWNSTASGGVQKFVSLRKIRKSIIPLPPLAEQNQIVRKIDKISKMLGE
ncbi:restriction endonuclease subunit S [Lactobacillus intestinalis]|uniref:Restriction endonuclease subunit S n=1 Tax=Lactobacillus intestinalis TaxID=151781 RepID=A0A4S2BRP6_9LACO|nr:restriction endonuclease subunit S [Lactobacillus intestinalis]TGY16915.1 restriction endonuclease subunit S [Lactobacillus intestinalis]